MTDLVDEVRASFDLAKHHNSTDGAVTVLGPSDVIEVPGFTGMKSYYDTRITVITRRGYRHFAGATLTHDADALLTQTAEVMATPMLATLFRAFSDGVMTGHQDDHLVRMAIYFDRIDSLWNDTDFVNASGELSSGFADDDEVCTYFSEYMLGGINHLAHTTGYAHSQVEPNKVWDIWIMGGMACACASFIAGNKLGSTWRERDVLDGIAIATEEAPGGSTGEDSSDH